MDASFPNSGVAIPYTIRAPFATIILISIGVAISLVFGALFGGMGGWHGRM